MAIDTDTARKIARLARIAVPEAELPKLAAQLSGILGFMEQLNEVDVTEVEPMVSVTPMRLVRRADGVTAAVRSMVNTSAMIRPMRNGSVSWASRIAVIGSSVWQSRASA